MKKNLFILIPCLWHTLLSAQPEITSTDLLKVGDVVITQPCATTSFHPGSAGANQVWDFSQLVAEGPEDSTFYISPIGTPYAADYPSSNIASRFGGNQYGYYQLTGDRLFYWGQKDPSTSLVLTDPAVYFKSPATFGTFVADTVAGSLSSGPLNGAVSGSAYFQGDGYGSLSTPGGQYSDVLRIRTLTVAVVTVPFFGTITDSVFNYSWYKSGIKTPVLEMIDDTEWAGGTVLEQSRYINYYRSLTSSAAKEPAEAGLSALQLSPNPAADAFAVSFELLESRQIALRLLDVSGNLILAQEQEGIPGKNKVNLETTALPNGVYIVDIQSGNMHQQNRLVVQHN